MERSIKYKRFTGTYTENTIQDFLDNLVKEGWEIIYYNEIFRPSGMLTNSPQEVNIHVTVIGSKKQKDVL
jgi:hypothetical protein